MRAWVPPRAKPAPPADWRDWRALGARGFKRVRCFNGGCFEDSVAEGDELVTACPACGSVRVVVDRPTSRPEARA